MAPGEFRKVRRRWAVCEVWGRGSRWWIRGGPGFFGLGCFPLTAASVSSGLSCPLVNFLYSDEDLPSEKVI